MRQNPKKTRPRSGFWLVWRCSLRNRYVPLPTTLHTLCLTLSLRASALVQCSALACGGTYIHAVTGGRYTEAGSVACSLMPSAFTGRRGRLVKVPGNGR